VAIGMTKQSQPTPSDSLIVRLGDISQMLFDLGDRADNLSVESEFWAAQSSVLLAKQTLEQQASALKAVAEYFSENRVWPYPYCRSVAQEVRDILIRTAIREAKG
jgi:hypothetical protein